MTLPFSHRLLLWLALAAALTACDAGNGPLPVRPQLVLAGFDDEVTEQIQAAEAAVQAQPETAATNAALADLLHSYRQYEWAATYYERARLLDPDNFDLAYLHGLVLIELGETEAALDALMQARELRDDYVPANLLLASLLAESGQREQSRIIYEEILDQEPDSPQALLGRAGLLTAAGSSAEEAVALLERAANPRRPYAKAHYALANAYRKQGRAEAADAQLEFFQRFKGREPALDDPLLQRLTSLNRSKTGYMSNAMVMLDRGNNLAAANYLESVLRKDPSDMAAYTYLIMAYGNLGNYSQAQSSYDTALEMGDAPVQLHGNMGVLELKRKRYRAAEDLFRKALAIDEEYALGHFYLGATLETVGEPREALTHYERAVALDGENRQAGHYLANMYRKLGNHDAAIGQFERIVQIEDANTAQYLKDMATAYVRQDNYAQALATLDRALSIAREYGQDELLASLLEEHARVERVGAKRSANGS